MATQTQSEAFHKLEEQLTCSICLEQYTNPKILPCFHSFCVDCLKCVELTQQQGIYSLPCPTCRSPCKLPQQGVDALPSSFTINNLTEVYNLMKKNMKVTVTGYDVSNIPKWCEGLSSLQYEILPVYRTVKDFHRHKQEHGLLYTDPFYTSNGGYKARLCVDPNGRGSGKGTHVSVSIYLIRGPNDDKLPFPINGIFTIQMLNWKADHHHIERSIEFDESRPIEDRARVTRGRRANGRGKHQFLSHNDVASMDVLHEDMMCFKISYTPIIKQTDFSPIPTWYALILPRITLPKALSSQLSSTWITSPCTRTLYNFTAYKNTKSIWYSQPFYSVDKGYKLQLRVDANDEESGEGPHLSLYVYVMKGEYDDTLSWPFSANITVQILNWSSDSHHEEITIDHYTAPLECRQRVVHGIRAPNALGYDFITHTKLQDTTDRTVSFIKDDNICFRITRVELI